MTSSADHLVDSIRHRPLPPPADLPEPRRARRPAFLRRRTPAAAPRREPAADLGAPVEVDGDDPLVGWLERVGVPVEVASVPLDTLGVRWLRGQGVHTVVPLMSGGELVGMLALGPPAHDDGYSRDERALLEGLAERAGPAVRVGQLVEERSEAARERERIDHELEVARLVQQHFLPTDLPRLPQWQVAAFYRPARSVGGDFYDFVPLPDGRVMVVVGDVTDKGVPAALVMSSTHALLRSHGPRLRCPSEVLRVVNELLCTDTPAHMFVTCLVMVLDPESGEVELANAGHNLPLVRRAHGVEELRATGMPLGLMPGSLYERTSAVLEPGDALLLHSDGLAEAHDGRRRMFGLPRLAQLVGRGAVGQDLIDLCLRELAAFAGPGAEQEDDITLVTLVRGGGPAGPHADVAAGQGADRGADRGAARGGERGDSGADRRGSGDDGTRDGGGGDATGDGGPGSGGGRGGQDGPPDHGSGEVLDDFSIPSVPGTERRVVDRVLAAVAPCGLAAADLERLATAVGETTMNAIEHGNGNREHLPVAVRVLRAPPGVEVQVSDTGAGGAAGGPPALPDLDLKLAGLQPPRGWGMFLVRSMADEVSESRDGDRHTVHLTVRPSLGTDAPTDTDTAPETR